MKVAVIGGGNMGGAIARGLYKSGLVKANDLYVADKSEAVLEATKKDIPGVNTSDDGKNIVKDANYVIVAVKPWLMEPVVTDLSASLDPKQHTFISIAAGVALEKVKGYLGNRNFTLFRILPNTAIAMLESMSFIKVVRTAGLDVIRIQKEITPEECAELYYNELNGNQR